MQAIVWTDHNGSSGRRRERERGILLLCLCVIKLGSRLIDVHMTKRMHTIVDFDMTNLLSLFGLVTLFQNCNLPLLSEFFLQHLEDES